jgi:hypothetical protein
MHRTDSKNGTPRACLAVKQDRLTVYLNKTAILYLANRLSQMASSEPENHFEVHLSMELDPSGVLAPDLLPKKVWTLFEPEMLSFFERRWKEQKSADPTNLEEFDLNLMIVTETELDEMAQFQASRRLPAEDHEK